VSDALILAESDLAGLAGAILGGTGRVAAPVLADGRRTLAWLETAEEFLLPEVNTVNSIKEFFFPAGEVIFGYRQSGGSTEILPAGAAAIKPFVVFGVRPCDAASLEIMDKVFNWDTTDESWKARRDAATVVVIGCRNADRYCFCTSVGLAPDARQGADVILLPTAGGNYIAEAVTDKGRALVSDYRGFFKPQAAAALQSASVPGRTDAGKARKWLEGNFEAGLWERASSRCLGCGICTYYCPTCHCFDIQDEADAGAGVRFKVWDSCSFGLFTKHASGHNPRPDRRSRWRQRIMHKFCCYPERFGVVSCTGCGRCGRLCPVDLGVEETLGIITGESA